MSLSVKMGVLQNECISCSVAMNLKFLKFMGHY